MNRFPDDRGADIFVREYPKVIAPMDSKQLNTNPPLHLLAVPGEGNRYLQRVSRVINSLVEPLEHRGKLVPYALVSAEPGIDLLSLTVGRQLAFGVPRNMTPDQFADFALLRDLISQILYPPQPVMPDGVTAAVQPDAVEAHTLRNGAYRKRAERGGLPGFLWTIGGGPAPATGTAGSLLNVLWLPLVRTLPRWMWGRRQTRRLIRSGWFRKRPKWLGEELNMVDGRENLFEVMAAVAQRQMPRLGQESGHERREEALRVLEHLLVRALLADCGRPAIGRIMPKRRRRTARPVVLVNLPREESEELRVVERFLLAFHRARATSKPPGLLVVAVGSPSERLLSGLGIDRSGPGSSSLSQVGLQLGEQCDTAVLVSLEEEAFTVPGLPVQRVVPKLYKTPWRIQTAVTTVMSLLFVTALGGVVYAALPEPDRETRACVGGDGRVADTAGGGVSESDVKPKTWYDDALAMIEKQNEKVEEVAAAGGRHIRTVVHFGSDRPTDRTETLFDGTIPELRGIAMWQQKINSGAQSDDSRVLLRVDVRTTGRGFQNAEKEAKKLVEEMKKSDGGEKGSAKEVVGVLGFAQSKYETKAALAVLARHGVPTVGTTATADEMLDQSTGNYWPLTPLNTTEARIAAQFAGGQSIVDAPGAADGCTSAEHAVVVQSSGDLYSRSIAQKFQKEFQAAGGKTKLIDFSKDGEGGEVPPGTPIVGNASDLAQQVCDALESERKSIVYWSARARDFTAFVDRLDEGGTCTQKDITVLGGNELTNVALTGKFDDKDWLRLYYSAHRLPVPHTLASPKTEQFVREYAAIEGVSPDHDPWIHDGHSAVAYDAFHVLSRAVDSALTETGVSRHTVLVTLKQGVVFQGATGHVEYGDGVNLPPKDKTLVLLRQTDHGPVVAAACGDYGPKAEVEKQKAPCR